MIDFEYPVWKFRPYSLGHYFSVFFFLTMIDRIHLHCDSKQMTRGKKVSQKIMHPLKTLLANGKQLNGFKQQCEMEKNKPNTCLTL